MLDAQVPTYLEPPSALSSHSRSGVEVAIRTAAVTLLVPLALVVEDQAPLVELEHAPQGLLHGAMLPTRLVD